VNDTFLGDEFKDAGVGGSGRILWIAELEHPRGIKIERSEVGEGRWWQDD